MDSHFAGVSQADHAILTRAARMYTNLTGEDASRVLSSIPIKSDKEDPEVTAKRAKEDLERQASAQRKRETAEQEARRAEQPRAPGAKAEEEAPAKAEEKPPAKPPVPASDAARRQQANRGATQ